MAERQHREVEDSIARQRDLVKQLRRDGRETAEAEQWLARLENLLPGRSRQLRS